MWDTGNPIVLREIWGDQVFEARPASVVLDLPLQTTLFVAPFVRCGAWRSTTRASSSGSPDRPWHLYTRDRGDFGVLSFAWPDTPYAILLLSEPDGSPRGWYVNLQTPLQRTTIGFDTVDHLLDVLIPMDRYIVVMEGRGRTGRGDRAGLRRRPTPAASATGANARSSICSCGCRRSTRPSEAGAPIRRGPHRSSRPAGIWSDPLRPHGSDGRARARLPASPFEGGTA